MTTDRGRAALDKLVALLLPALAGHVPWTYEVIAAYPGPPVTVDLKAMAPTNPFGNLAAVTIWPGPDGGVALPTPGKLVLVRFNDALVPAVCGLDPTDTPAIVYQYGIAVQVGTAAALPLTKGPSYLALIAAIEAWASSYSSTPATAALHSDLALLGTQLAAAIAAAGPPVTVNALGS